MTNPNSIAPEASAVLAVTGLSKTYGVNRVLSDVSLRVLGGEVHALVGGNGSGKSTMVKLLAGVVPPDPGMRLEARGERIDAHGWSPEAARRAHLRFVHQDLGLFPDLSVADNLSVGFGYPTNSVGAIRRREAVHTARQLLDDHGLDVDPRRRIGDLSLSEQSVVAIARALQDVGSGSMACVFLDEPTAALPGDDRQRLLATLRRLAGSGHAIVLVTHHIEELLAVADRVTVVHDGELIHTSPAFDIDRRRLIELITGRPVSDIETGHRPAASNVAGDERLRVESLCAGPAGPVSLTVGHGEIVGLAGLPGSGVEDICRALFGLCPMSAGEVSIDGVRYFPRDPARAMATGIAFLPADRLRDGVFEGLSVLKNLTAATTTKAGRWRLRHRQERRRAQQLTVDYRIRPPELGRPIGTLSGGNQQKVLLGRWGCRQPKLLLLEDPTRGVDVGARSDVWRLLDDQARDRGLSVLVTSSDNEELAMACDRVMVFGAGHSVTVLRGDKLTAAGITHAMYETADTRGAA